MNLLPSFLTEQDSWCRCREKKPIRIDGRPARVNNPSDFTSYAEVAKHLADGEFAGFRITPGIVGFDADNCMVSGEPSGLVREIVDHFPGAYFEISPSGSVIHGFFKASDLAWFTPDKCRFKNSKLGLELYPGGETNRYIRVSGNALSETGWDADRDFSKEVGWLAEAYFTKDSASSVATPTAAEHVDWRDRDDPDVAELDDAKILAKVFSGKRGPDLERLYNGDYEGLFPSRSEAVMSLLNSLAFYTQRNHVQMERIVMRSGLNYDTKFGRKQSGSTWIRIQILKACQDCQTTYSPTYRADKLKAKAKPDDVAWLKMHNAADNSRYSQDELGAGRLLGDWLRPFARYCPEAKSWFVYDGRVWVKDTGGVLTAKLVKRMSDALQAYAAGLTGDNRKQALERFSSLWRPSKRRNNFLNDARAEHPIPISDFDADPWLFNCRNGTFDLRSFEFREHCADDLLTRISEVAYDPSATCERWDRFIQEVMLGDNETANFLQCWAGYCLTGDTSEDAAVILYGRSTRNGKSTFCETLSTVLGDYAAVINPESLSDQRRRDGSSPSEDIASLKGVRFAVATEPSQALQLDAARLKSLTGGESIRARFLGENSFEYRPEFKLTFNSNHLPRVNDISVFSSDRLYIVPFDRHFSAHERDKQLRQELRKPANLSGILNWAIQGLRMKRTLGLAASPRMLDVLTEYVQDSDKVGRFIDECLPLSADPDARIKAQSVYEEFINWCRNNGHHPESQSRFLSALRDRQINTGRKRPSPGDSTTTVVIGRELKMTA